MLTCSNPMISLSETRLAINIEILLELSGFGRIGLCKVIV